MKSCFIIYLKLLKSSKNFYKILFKTCRLKKSQAVEFNDTMEISFYNNNVTKSKKQIVVVGVSAASWVQKPLTRKSTTKLHENKQKSSLEKFLFFHFLFPAKEKKSHILKFVKKASRKCLLYNFTLHGKTNNVVRKICIHVTLVKINEVPPLIKRYTALF